MVLVVSRGYCYLKVRWVGGFFRGSAFVGLLVGRVALFGGWGFGCFLSGRF